MTDNGFKSKVAFIVETDGRLKDYLESIVIKQIKSDMPDDDFNDVKPNHVHAALMLKSIAPCALKKFAATMRMSRAAASALVDRMVRAGLVQREGNPDNRREVLLTVNPEFEAHVGHVRSEMIRWFEVLTNKMGVENFEKWHTAMVALNKVLNEEIHAGHAQK
nr:MarR family transcriptional regulator [uncultured Desulfobacter sp.]